jgi:hypothetical protein
VSPTVKRKFRIRRADKAVVLPHYMALQKHSCHQGQSKARRDYRVHEVSGIPEFLMAQSGAERRSRGFYYDGLAERTKLNQRMKKFALVLQGRGQH